MVLLFFTHAPVWEIITLAVMISLAICLAFIAIPKLMHLIHWITIVLRLDTQLSSLNDLDLERDLSHHA